MKLVIWEKNTDEDLPTTRAKVFDTTGTRNLERRCFDRVGRQHSPKATRLNNGNLNTNVIMVESSGLNPRPIRASIMVGGRGLNAWVQPGDFKEATVSYPNLPKREDADEQIERL